MKTKIKNVFLQILSCIITMGLTIGGWAGGFAINKNNPQLTSNPFIICLAVLCFVGIIALAVYNIRYGINFAKKINGLTATQRDEKVHQMKAEVEKDYEKAEKSVYNSIIAFNLYKIALILLLCLSCFFVGLTGLAEISIVFIILILFSGWGVVNSFFAVNEAVIDKNTLLTESEYPVLHGIIKKAASTINYQGKITVVCLGPGISIGMHKGGLLINIQSEEIALLTENELYAVMLHEFAHYNNQDTHRRNKFANFVSANEENVSPNPIEGFGKLLFLNGVAQKVVFNIVMFDTFSSRKKEADADLFVKEKMVANDYINATAKACLFTIYSEYPWKEITFDVYESTTPISDYSQRNYNNFLQKVALYGDKWHFTLKNELPARVDSHPTLATRMQMFEVSDYTVDFNVQDGAYKNEQIKLLEKTSALSINDLTKDKNGLAYYKTIRKDLYLDRISAMEKYEQFDSEWNSLSDSELIECAQAYLFIDDKKAEKILNEVIQRSNSSFACYLLACLYAREYNDACIELFKKSAIDTSATDEAFDQIGKYALKTGNQKLIEEYRATVVMKNQVAEEEIYETLFTNEGLTAPTAEHKETQELTQKLCEYWGDNLISLHVAVRETESQTLVYYIAIEANKTTPLDAVQKAYDESCYFINRMSCAGKKYYLFFSGKEYNAIRKVAGSCVYKKQK